MDQQNDLGNRRAGSLREIQVSVSKNSSGIYLIKEDSMTLYTVKS